MRWHIVEKGLGASLSHKRLGFGGILSLRAWCG